MGIEYKRKWCVHCQKYVRAEKHTPNSFFHFIMILLTCGLWLFIWGVLEFGSMASGYACPWCGGKV